VNHTQKVSRKGGNGNHSGQAVAALRYAVFAFADFATPFGGIGLFFK
jgi:hypothetical protein